METLSGWLLDELAHAGAEHIDCDYVAAYDRKAGPHLDVGEEVALLQRMGLDETGTLVDFGAGTGTVALAAAPSCHRVVAVDVSPAMVDALREKAERLGHANIECVQSGFLTYEHSGDAPAAVYSRNALHHLPDFWKGIALDRIVRILRPGGLLRLRDLVFSFDLDEAADVIEAWLETAPERADQGWTRAELEAHVREEHSTFTWLLEPMLEKAGFEIREAGYSDSRTYHPCTARA
jgi:ubiquinone/menaquinone biosynthesis C-methylase UbiE